MTRFGEHCTTCGDVYANDRLSVCSNAFHCCRDCTWLAGRVIAPCTKHVTLGQHQQVKAEERRVPTGVALIVYDKDGNVLMGKRKGSHGAGTFSFIGGWMRHGESFLDTAAREALEEAGIIISRVKVEHAMSTVFPDNDVHSVTVVLSVDTPDWSGVPKAMEPDKLDGEWNWYDIHCLPVPLFKPLEGFLPDFLAGW